ncbi:hypothetical protein BS47DRAFT_1320578 [Hydnum rufescens UP504]|uniref:Nuclear condensin complex subunit 3 C-terminal domain-containing protein n=1 Tax=Hydnum rufescens UP504 TaxID=1448309 RepID=A0A9P6AMY1_9AGAM|nr:hypothetical protein BS47DRAFT_1320578 [Hydnum rufescens UP504]
MEPRLEALTEAIAPIFMQCQHSLAPHKKNVIQLAKIHMSCADVWEEVPPRGIRLTGEKAFNDRFFDMVNRVFPIKKGVSNADRIIKFVGAFIMHIAQKATKEKEQQKQDGNEDDEDTPTSRLVAALLKHLIKGFQAKDKIVRFRVVQIVAELIFSLGEMDEDLYMTLRASLLERVRDKETPVRLQAVIALARLQRGEEGSDDSGEDQENLTDVLIDVLQYDPVAEVRRAALINIIPSPPTMLAILSRTRDEDNTMRKIVYHHVLASLPSPLVLTIAQREEICQNGLGDREPSVRSAAGNLIGGWVESVGGLEGFLRMLDVTTSKVAEDALFSVFVTRPDLLDIVVFPETYWSELTPERAFLARVFVDYCISVKEESRLETALPVVTALAFRIQHEYNALLALIEVEDPDEVDEDAEMEKGDKEFIIAELLKLAVNLDYADETGRRKMFALVRDMASAESLPEILVTRCLDVLRILSSSERELFMLIVEIVHELRDMVRLGDEAAGDEDSQFGDGDTSRIGRLPMDPRGTIKLMESVDPETRARWEDVNLRCLMLCIGMLERVNGTLEDNSVLDGLLSDFVLPAIHQKEPVWRERGMTLLGLMCLISKNMAKKSAQLFVGQAQPPTTKHMPRGYAEIQLRALQMLFDIVMVFHFDGLERDGGPRDGEAKILAAFEGALQDESALQVHAAACEGMAKLMLSGIVTDERVLARLVGLFIDPGTAANQPLRQCLSYFFPVYCYSSPLNQRRMQRIFIKSMQTLADLYTELDDEEMVTPAQVGIMLVDWTDPTKAVKVEGQRPDQEVHVDVAIEILRILFEKGMDKERKKTYVQLLAKLHIPEHIDNDKLRTLMLFIKNLRRRRPLQDTAARNALTRFEASLGKKFATQLENSGIDESELRKLEQLKDLFDFLDEITSASEEEIDVDNTATIFKMETREAPGHKRGARAKGSSKPPEQSEDGKHEKSNEEEEPAHRKRSGRRKAPPKAAQGSDDDDETTNKVEEKAVEGDLLEDEVEDEND